MKDYLSSIRIIFLMILAHFIMDGKDIDSMEKLENNSLYQLIQGINTGQTEDKFFVEDDKSDLQIITQYYQQAKEKLGGEEDEYEDDFHPEGPEDESGNQTDAPPAPEAKGGSRLSRKERLAKKEMQYKKKYLKYKLKYIQVYTFSSELLHF